MPTYEYSCNSCGERLEIVQSIHDDSLADCPKCGAPGLRKIFGNVGVVFKGSGFYRTDNRKDVKAASAASKSDSGSAKGGSDKSSSDKSSSDKSSSDNSSTKSTPTQASSGGTATAGPGTS